MHPSLDIRRLNQLSSAVRRAAQAMICENPSADTISTFITLACQGLEPHNQIHLLPTHWILATVDTTNLLRAGVTSLLLICELPSRLPAVSDLWPRVWAWIQFCHTYGEILRRIHCALTQLCENMTTDRSNESLMFGTPGFAAFTARSWAHERVIIILDNIFSGGKGSLDDLLDALFRRELDFAIGTSSGKPWLLSGILNMLSHADDKREANNFGVRSPTPLYSALVPLNFVGPLTLIVSKLTQPNELIPHVKHILRHTISVLEMCFRGPRRDQTLRVAIQSSPPCVVYHDVIPDLVTAYSSASVGLQQREFFDPAVSQSLIDFEAADRVYRRACDNMKCKMISDRTNLKRCAGCRELLYCSRACQISDWQTGHRESCRFHFAYHKKIRASYTAKEHAFLRFLFHRDAVKSMPSLNPNTKFAAVYDYRITHHQGRMSLDLMGLVEGENKWAVVFPYRWRRRILNRRARQEEAMGKLLAGEGSGGIH
ncbi:hypothetical protein R3P38DRAFT_3098032 [Favolaschia claudopus]|uniref:MYND-type domain-containing protein n=1 Tax=Favolaschia claudopus TaxID=2862362 RepID=A0AAV9ZPE7_9AGAR